MLQSSIGTCVFTSCQKELTSESQAQNLILGKWKMVSADLDTDGISFRIIAFDFLESGVVKETLQLTRTGLDIDGDISESIQTYAFVSKDTLLIGNKIYPIQKLDKEQLRLKFEAIDIHENHVLFNWKYTKEK